MTFRRWLLALTVAFQGGRGDGAKSVPEKVEITRFGRAADTT